VQQSGRGGAAVAAGAVAAGAGGAAIMGSVGGNLTIINSETAARELLGSRQSEPQLQRALGTYLCYVLDKYRYLDFRGLGVADRVPLRLDLLELFVPLKARVEMPKGETWERQLHLAGRPVAESDRAAIAERLSEPLPLLDLLDQNPGLIILGDPGAGKTTFLKYAAMLQASGRSDPKRLPVLLPLSAYANALVERDVRLDDFIAGYFRNLGADLPLDHLLREAIERGNALIMLDGLDEVTDFALRDTVVRRVVDFFNFHRRAGNKFLLTSRIVGYREVRPSADGLAECTLVDFDDAEIEAFVTKWTAALEKAASGDTRVAAQDAQRECRELLDAVRRNPGVRRLAANPLLLTVLALMKRQGVTLPERRVELYDKYVTTLLSSWNRARGLDRAPTRDLDVGETVKLLAPLALWMHTVNPGVGLVKKVDLEDELRRLLVQRGEPQPDQAGRQFIKDVHDYTSVLLERGPGQYGFIHLTFEEYLAAVAVAQQGQVAVEPVVRTILERVGEPAWREVILLAVAYLGIVQQREKAASQVVEGMLEGGQQTGAVSVVVAGEAVADAGNGVVTPALRERTIESLAATMTDDANVKLITRAAAGDALARLGDPRREVVPQTLEDLGAMQFCYVPPGPFIMGDGKRPNDSITEGYWIGRFPVTVAQYAWFRKEGGYGREQFWTEAHKAGIWQDGKFKPRYESDWADGPMAAPHPFDLGNHPVAGVSWYEAIAFCRWLTDLRKADLPDGYQFTLPSEAQWEMVARGGIQLPAQQVLQPVGGKLVEPVRGAFIENPEPKREYPWGNEFDPNRVNSAESKVGSTSSVGCFGKGASPYGVLEMSGNVWEWTCSLSRGGEDLAASAKQARVLRGGSFFDDRDLVRCAPRDGGYPDSRDTLGGFRVVVSPF